MVKTHALTGFANNFLNARPPNVAHLFIIGIIQIIVILDVLKDFTTILVGIKQILFLFVIRGLLLVDVCALIKKRTIGLNC